MHILVTRPQPEGSRMKAQLEAAGHQVTLDPLLRIEPIALDASAFEGAQALIATSRNGLRALGLSPAFATARRLPVFTVGPGTAELARELSFARIFAGSGNARDLVPLIASEADPAKGPLLHVAGEVTAFDIGAALAQGGFDVRTLTAYRAVPSSALADSTAQGLAEGTFDAVILMSPRSANIFAQLVADRQLQASAHRLVVLCLSQAVADATESLAPARVEVAEAPNGAAMLAAVGRVASRCREV
jgi:uroporphyrinogen-III synthase